MRLLVALLFLGQGLLVGGVLPIVHRLLPAEAAHVYTAYYAGLVVGQLLVVRWGDALGGIRTYALAEAAFGSSLVLMGATFAFAPWNVVGGRLLEGVLAGIALPLGLACVARLGPRETTRRRIGVFNSLFAAGFVAGPPLAESVASLGQPGTQLVAFGVAYGGVALALGARGSAGAGVTAERGATPKVRWVEGALALFIAKAFYAYLQAFLAAGLVDQLRPLGVAAAMVALAAVFILGQAVGALLLGRLSGVARRVGLPLVLAAGLLTAWLAGPMPAIFVAALAHSLLVLHGYSAVAESSFTPKSLARANLASDPGLAAGALLAHWGWGGAGGVVLLCLLPAGLLLLRRAASPRTAVLPSSVSDLHPE